MGSSANKGKRSFNLPMLELIAIKGGKLQNPKVNPKSVTPPLQRWQSKLRIGNKFSSPFKHFTINFTELKSNCS